THITLEFAARYPELVRKIVITRPFPAVSINDLPDFGRSMTRLIEEDWPHYTDINALSLIGWSETGRQYAEQLRRDWTPATWLACDAAVAAIDAQEQARTVEAPALVIAREQDIADLIRVARRLAAALPHADLLISPMRPTRDPAIVPLIEAFLG